MPIWFAFSLSLCDRIYQKRHLEHVVFRFRIHPAPFLADQAAVSVLQSQIHRIKPVVAFLVRFAEQFQPRIRRRPLVACQGLFLADFMSNLRLWQCFHALLFFYMCLRMRAAVD